MGETVSTHSFPVPCSQRPHVTSMDCWCRPTVTWSYVIAAHNGNPYHVILHREEPTPNKPTPDGETK